MDGDGAGHDWRARYLSQLATQRQLSPHTIAAYGRDLAELAALLGIAEPAWQDVQHADIRRITSKLHAQSLSARSIARKLSSWRGFFNWLAQHAALAANPVDGVRAPKRPKTLPKALSVDDAVHLVAAGAHAHPEPAELCNRAMFELLYSSGLRVSELAALDLVYMKAEGGAAASLGWIDLAER